MSQIECSSLARGDPDCNQYITGQSGTVTSYNWPNIQLRSKTHNICIRRELGEIINFHVSIKMSNLTKFVFICADFTFEVFEVHAVSSYKNHS